MRDFKRQICIEPLEERAMFAVVQWIHNGDGNWNDPANWIDGTTLASRVPDGNDDVIVSHASGAFTITVTDARSVRTLSTSNDEAIRLVTGGSLFVNQASTVAGIVAIDGGTFNGNAPVTSTGTVTLSEGIISFPQSGLVIDTTGAMVITGAGAKSLFNQGLTIQGGAINNGSNFNASAPIRIDAAATLDLQDDSTIGGGGTIFVSGTLKKSTGAGQSTLNKPVNLTGGKIESLVGSLILTGGGTSTGGTLDTAVGASIEYTGPSSHAWTGTYTGNGNGSVIWSGNIHAFDQSGVTVILPGNSLQWTGGSISGNTFKNLGTLTLSGSANKTVGATLENYGHIIHADNGNILNGVGNGFGSYARNFANATFEIRGDGDNDISQFFNAGSIVKSGGAGTAEWTGSLYIQPGGITSVLAGKLKQSGGGIHSGPGYFFAATGATLEFSNGFAFAGTYTGLGTGRIEFTGGNFFGMTNNDYSALPVLNFAPGLLQFLGGTLGGGGSFGGPFGGGSGSAIVNQGEITIDGNAGKGFGNIIINENTITHKAAGSPTITGGTIRNLGIYDIQADVTFDSITFDNRGILRKSAGGGIALFDRNGANFNSDRGNIELLSGQIEIKANGFWGGGGLLLADAGTKIILSNDIKTFSGLFTGEGPGTLEISSLFQGDGTVFAELNFPVDFAHIVGGQLLGSIVNNGTMYFDAVGGVFTRALIRNNGTWIHAGTGDLVLNANSRVENNGIYLIQTDADFVVPGDASGGNMNFVNTGTIRKSGGLGTTAFRHDGSNKSLRFDNQGVVEVQSGTISLDDPIVNLSGSTLIGGTWYIGPFATLIIGIGNNITTNQANVTLAGITSTFAKFNTVNNNKGTMRFLDGRDFATLGSLTNIGTIEVGKESTLTINGTLTQSGDARLLFEIGGTVASRLYGQIVVNGAANLDAIIRPVLVDGFGPVGGGSYTIMSFPSHTAAAPFFAGTSPFFDPVVLSNFVVLNTTGSGSADIQVDSFAVNPNAVPGQNVTVNYSITNNSNVAVGGDWTDSIYLSRDTTLSADDLLIGRTNHTGGLAGLGSYNGSLTAALPGVVEGNYNIIIVTDSKLNVPDNVRANNTRASSNLINIDVQDLAFGTTVGGMIDSNEDIYYKVNVTTLGDLKFQVSQALSSQAEFYVSYNSIPTRTKYDYTASNIVDLFNTITVPSPQAGDFYVLIHGRQAAASGHSYTIRVDQIAIGITSLDLNRGSNLGTVTTTVKGSGFTPDTVIKLKQGVVERPAAQLIYQNANQVQVLFNLTGLAVGSYDIVAQNGNGSATLSGGFTVTNGAAGKLEVRVSMPPTVRPGRSADAVIEYKNTGETNIPAPLLNLTAGSAIFELVGQIEPKQDFMAILATNPNGPAGVLPPGFVGKITVKVTPTGPGGSDLHIVIPEGAQTINWDSYKASLRPSTVPGDAWDTIYNNYKQDVGTTYGQLNTYLDNIATYLGQLGVQTNDPLRLQRYALRYADGFGAISTRYQLSSLGRGRIDETSIIATTQTNGDVSISYGGKIRYFNKLSDGSYIGDIEDTGVLKRVSNHYELSEVGGRRTVFNDNGTWNFAEDRAGNRMTAGYTGNLVTSVTNSDGDTITYQYNGAGRLIQRTDHVGRISTYTYDASNEHLLTYTSAGATTTYSYVTGQGANREHAVSTITLNDGSTVNFSYDNRGRLSEVKRNGTQLSTKYSYNEFGKVTVTDPAGKTSSVYYSDAEKVERIIDDQGGVTNLDYNSRGDLTKVSGTAGLTSSFASDSKHNPAGATDPNGNSTASLFDPKYGFLTTLKDANSHITQTLRNGRGQVTSYTYDNGDQATFEYDARGNLLAFHTVNGDTIHYAYSSKNLLTQAEYADGTAYSYSYDAHRNLTSITEPSGTTSFVYDNFDRFTKVTYPNGRSLTYNYDTADRVIQIMDQSGFAIKYSYDPLGRLDKVRDGSNALIAAYTYDIVGRLQQETRGNGTYTTYSYTSSGQSSSIIHYAANNSIQERFDYVYNSRDLPISVTTLSGITRYEYDSIGQLTKIILPNGDSTNYEYDGAGNRIRTIENASASNYTTNALNQYTQVGTISYTYNLNGSIQTKTDASGVTTYSYDNRGRLIQVTGPTDTWEYEYNILGQRNAAIHNGVRTEYLIDVKGLGNVWAEYDNSNNLAAHYAQGIGLVGRFDNVGVAAYYGFDALGNTSLVTDSSGAVANSYSYKPFGEKITSVETIDNAFTFVGRYGVMEEGNGLYYMRNRFYDPALGRFTSRDPINLLGGNNLYRYAENSPTLFVDPTGLKIAPPPLPMLAAGDKKQIAIKRIWNELADTVSDLRRDANQLNMKYGTKTPELTQSSIDYAKDAVKRLRDLGVDVDGRGLTDEVSDAVNQAEDALVKYEQKLADFADKFKDVAKNAPDGPTLTQQVGNALTKVDLPATIGEYLLDPHLATWMGMNTNLESPFGDEASKKHVPENALEKPYEDAVNDALLSLICRTVSTAEGISVGFLIVVAAGTGPLGLLAAVGGGFLYSKLAEMLCWGVGYTFSIDPNSIEGVQGYGPENYISEDKLMTYDVHFENLPAATAPAQTVSITQQLDSDLDLSTFEFGDFGFGDIVIDVPDGRNSYATRIDLSATKGFYVDVSADIDLETGLVTWNFAAIDPATGDLVSDALAGFLPPNATSPEGEGFVKYSVRPKTGLTTGTRIDAKATIVFDTNAPIDTNAIFHTIDASGPSSSVTALPAQTDTTTFNVLWSGADDVGGAGIGTYDVYLSDNGGEFVRWQTRTSNTSAAFTGENGHTYRFYSVAFDRVGHVEDAPATFDAMTEVAITNLTTDVTVTVSGGNLLIEGNGVSNHILITKGATANQVIITGLLNSDRGENSTINGLSSMTFNNVTGTITINMFEGNDEVEIRNIIHQGSVVVNGGTGNDKTTLGRKFALTQSDSTAYTRIVGALTINGEDGDDTITLGRVYGYGTQTINGGNDTDTISIYVDFAGMTNISGGNGNDDIQVGYLTANQTLTMNGNQGNDLVTLYGSRAIGAAFFYGEAGLDTIALDVNRYDSNVTVDTGNDADTLLFARSVLAADAILSTGSGSDTLLLGKYYGRNASNQVVLLNGGSTAKKVTINTGTLNDSVQSATNRIEQFFADLGGGNDSLDSLNDLVSLRYEWNGNTGTDSLKFVGINTPSNGKLVTNFET